LTKVIANSSEAYNILYRTTDSHCRPSWAVTTLFVPLSNTTTTGEQGEKSLLSYQIQYDSPSADRSPSYTLYTAPSPVIADALGRGLYVNVPDYEGPYAAFTDGLQSGQATLDSLRAVLSFGHGLCPYTRYVLWGYSGGALASEWAAELQGSYAPELNIRGVAIGGLTPNISSVIYSVSGTPFAGLAPLGILGLANVYPEVRDLLQERLNPTGLFNKTTFLSASNGAPEDVLPRFAFQNILDYFQNGADDLTSPVLQAVIAKTGIMGTHGVPSMPMFVYKAVADMVSNVEHTDQLVHQYCEEGASIIYQRNTVGGHVSDEINGQPAAVEFLSDRLAGVNFVCGCETQHTAIAISDVPL
jgi:hypothetical protein